MKRPLLSPASFRSSRLASTGVMMMVMTMILHPCAAEEKAGADQKAGAVAEETQVVVKMLAEAALSPEKDDIIQRMEDSRERQEAQRQRLQDLVRAVRKAARVDPPGTMRAVIAAPPSGTRSMARDVMAGQLAAEHVEALMEALAQSGIPADKGALLEMFSRHPGRPMPSPAAVEKLFAKDKEGRFTAKLATAMGRTMAEEAGRTGNPPFYVDAVKDAVVVRAVNTEALREMALYQPELMFRLLEEHWDAYSAAGREAALGQVMQSHVKEPATRTRVLELAAHHGAEDSLLPFVKAWAEADLEGAQDWVLEIPDKTLRTRAEEGLLDFLQSRGRKPQAEKWAWRVEQAR